MYRIRIHLERQPTERRRVLLPKVGYGLHTNYNAIARSHLAGSQNACALATAKNIVWKHIHAGQKVLVGTGKSLAGPEVGDNERE